MSIGKLLLSLGCVAWASTAFAQSFNIDVSELLNPPTTGYAAAGLPGYWNAVRADHITPFTTGPTPQDIMLVDIYGNQTSVGFHQYGGNSHVTDNDPNIDGENADLLNDYLATHSAVLESCMYLNGLQDGTYEVLVYAWMPNQPSVMQKVRFDFNPGSEQFIGGAWPGQHEQGVTYSRHIIEVTNGFMGFHVGIPAGGSTALGAAFNGFQVNYLDGGPVPTISQWGLMTLGALLVAAAAIMIRQRKAKPVPAPVVNKN